MASSYAIPEGFRHGSRVYASLRPGRPAFEGDHVVYILASQKNGTLYVGVTNRLSSRIEAHRDGRGSEFAREHHVFRLVYAEHYDDPREAIAQEKRIKHWRRRWKIDLIERSNPEWNDLYPSVHLD